MKTNQKGITLVALVITIIVLLILAGVSIAALGGQNGILTNATRAKAEDEVGNAKDQINLAANEGLQAYFSKTYAGGKDTLTATTEQAAVVEYIEKVISDDKKIGNASVTHTTGETTFVVKSSDGSRQETGTVGDKGGVTWVKDK